MKRLIAFFGILCMVVGFAACSTPQTTDIKGTTPNVGNPGDPNAYYFNYKGTDIRLNGDMEVVLNALGEPKNYTEETSCAFEGLDKTYTYDSFVIQTYPKGEKDYVYAFWFLDDLVKTPEGVKIGDTQAAVEAAYGAEGYNGRNAYILKKDTYSMTIIQNDGAVSSIQYTITIG
ncbi:MAG: hypothetical protein IJZ15_00545 [Oscillospiraceae bacterium]|nr:hypothetical protein [Oscillospiraceae bacterium]